MSICSKEEPMHAAPETPVGVDVESLLDEIRRYLDAVDTFRSEGRSPRWRATDQAGRPS
jgi:hypothetical protein